MLMQWHGIKGLSRGVNLTNARHEKAAGSLP